MVGYRLQSRLWIAAGALVAVIGACGPLGTPATGAPTATLIVLPSATPTRNPLPENVSATAVPVFPTPTPQVSTPAPEVSPALTGAPPPKAACTPPQVDPALMGTLKWVAYCDTRYGFGFRYPSAGEDSYAGGGRVYLPYLLGTNLAEKWLDVTVSEGQSTCSSPQAAGYQQGTVPTENMTFNGIPFIKESGGDAGAGNYYGWTAFSTLKGGLCVSMTFTLHWVNAMNYETPPPEFDEAAESAVFTTIMSTFAWFTP